MHWKLYEQHNINYIQIDCTLKCCATHSPALPKVGKARSPSAALQCAADGWRLGALEHSQPHLNNQILISTAACSKNNKMGIFIFFNFRCYKSWTRGNCPGMYPSDTDITRTGMSVTPLMLRGLKKNRKYKCEFK